jgi:hypothetical protein
MNFHSLPDAEPRTRPSVIVFWAAILLIFSILGSLKAAWWQAGLVFVLVYLVRYAARREVV